LNVGGPLTRAAATCDLDQLLSGRRERRVEGGVAREVETFVEIEHAGWEVRTVIQREVEKRYAGSGSS